MALEWEERKKRFLGKYIQGITSEGVVDEKTNEPMMKFFFMIDMESVMECLRAKGEDFAKEFGDEFLQELKEGEKIDSQLSEEKKLEMAVDRFRSIVKG